MRWAIRIGVLLLVISGVTAGVFLLTKRGFDLIPNITGCRASVNDHEVLLSIEQSENAALIVALGAQRGLPPRAASIALATAIQESKLTNLTSGDRDSLGLFQQRPSQGWGTQEQILNPIYATNTFYDALVELPNYQNMAITDAAQAVQRSAFPQAYADHELDARTLASALSGETSGGAFYCVTRGTAETESSALNEIGLTQRADAVREELKRVFGEQPLGGFEPGGATSGHMENSAHYEGRAIDIFFRPISAKNNQKGWASAQYLVAHAERLDIRSVIFDDRIWTSGSLSDEGWRDYRVPSSSAGDQDILEHRDHVHVEVFE
jgi:hypothetical protein